MKDRAQLGIALIVINARINARRINRHKLLLWLSGRTGHVVGRCRQRGDVVHIGKAEKRKIAGFQFIVRPGVIARWQFESFRGAAGIGGVRLTGIQLVNMANIRSGMKMARSACGSVLPTFPSQNRALRAGRRPVDRRRLPTSRSTWASSEP
uniref:Uncharacterized protein n=1 Tax=Methylomicrobium album TaxID=39775 RepID=P71490_METAL|nr:unknown [Methylomicrobium album BG8]